ncbi:APC family permease [Fangia hongkongensis]|uniref:APC family permease n=2 Tax=Fangia hongkongensis TaxID=270495 RepID=UPI001F1D8EB7|nr:APC family permease [Fangia hongkongensis]
MREQGEMMEKKLNSPGLFSAIALSVGTMMGSGWLFASYYASKAAGGASIFSWIIGAVAVLIMALLLAEIAIKYPVNGLFTRLISISHNQHFGFVTGISNWLLGLIVIPSEAMATTQYIASIYTPLTPHIFHDGALTAIGVLIVGIFMLLYTLINYWGIQFFAKINNSITLLKIIIPIATAVTILIAAFHSGNFTAEKHAFAPFGAGSVFSAIVSCGIFYSFFGFQVAASFTAELKNPKRNVPIALVSSVIIVLVIYLLLQIAFIGALPPHMLDGGWQGLNFESPLAQLSGLLGLNVLAVILYADALVSPSGTGLIYMGASTRMLNEMAKHKQMPKVFAKTNPKIAMSRASLIFTFICSLVLIIFFRNWQLIASLTTTFILISCVALPIAYCKLKANKNEPLPLSYLPCSQLFAFVIYLFLTYLLMISGITNLAIALVLHIAFFVLYIIMHRKNEQKDSLGLMLSASWGIFLYLAFELIAAIILKNTGSSVLFYSLFFIVSALFYVVLVKQKRIS